MQIILEISFSPIRIHIQFIISAIVFRNQSSPFVHLLSATIGWRFQMDLIGFSVEREILSYGAENSQVL